MTPEEAGIEGHWPVQRPHRIRWAECDLYGHVNHAAYLTLCEDLRVSQWLALGGSFSADGVGPVVAQLEAKYLRALRFDEEVVLTLRTASFRRTSYIHEYAFWRGGLCFSARAVLVLVEGATGARVPIPEPIRAAWLAEGAAAEG